MANVIIVGGGVIGASCAYFLSQRGVKPLVLEATGVACSSSGKAGGFLALDWCDSSSGDELARTSYLLHAQLAESLGIETGYRAMKTHSISVQQPTAASSRPKQQGAANLPKWVRRDSVEQASVIGTESTTAQVHPELFTKALLQRAQEAGASLRLAAVTGLEVAGRRVTGVCIRDKETGEDGLVPVEDKVLFTMGVWSGQLQEWLPPATMPPVSGLKVHSIVLSDPEQKTSADALFLAYRGSDGKSLEPEVYPRPNGQVYICGVSEDVAPPPRADQIAVNPEALETLRGVAASVSDDLAQAEVLQAQACFLPTTEDGQPLIGHVPGLDNAYVATGHSCWGILNAPATGLAIAELLVDGRPRAVDLRPFDPARFGRLSVTS